MELEAIVGPTFKVASGKEYLEEEVMGRQKGKEKGGQYNGKEDNQNDEMEEVWYHLSPAVTFDDIMQFTLYKVVE